MTRILILGGTGETGSWFARYFKDKGFDVAVWGPSGKVAVAERLGVRYAHDMMKEVEESDIVLISVLIEKTVEVIRQVAPRMRPGSLIMDVTSLKSEPVKAMKTYAPKGVEVLGTHPMFGPTMPAMKGQTIILTPVERKTGKWLPKMKALFESDGAHVEVLDADERVRDYHRLRTRRAGSHRQQAQRLVDAAAHLRRGTGWFGLRCSRRFCRE